MTSTDTAGLIQQAHALDRAGQHAEALAALHRAAQAGDVGAMTYLGSRLASGRGAPLQPEPGARWLIRAGELGGPAARRTAAALIAAGVGVPAEPTRAMDWLRSAAEAGDPSAKGQLEALGEIDLDAWLKPAAPEIVSEAPRVRVFRQFVSPGVCDWVRRSSADRLISTAVNGADGAGDRALEMRTATGAGYALLDTDVVLALVRARIAAATQTPVRQFEPTNVLSYEVGQEYRPHFDFFNTDIAHFARIVAAQGQRSLTFLIYLNDDYHGGETTFPRLDYALKARAGDALMFHNVDETGTPDPRTLHAGAPTTRGRKWLLSQWIRDRPQPIV